MNREAGAADRPLFPSPLYAIFDPSQSRGRPLSTILQDLLAGGVGIIQLRAKETAAKEFLRLAREMRGLTRPAGCLFIVNDRLDIALAAQADGVHLGQEDLPLAIARKLMGREKIIGISTHDLAQAKEAERGGADYIGFGPIFGTATKDTGYSARGLAMLKEIRKAVKIPIVAIGGINETNVAQVWEAGADAAAIISDLMGAEDLAGKVKRILALSQTL
ncbi:MAG: thiamine phosphate synthase [Deltaproteobacteria bacterium]|nr:thiamine phosphate synthase [Deltaproteobacteria bacterium]